LRHLRETFIRVFEDERGASLVEYGFLVVLIAIVAYTAVQLAGTQLSTMYNDIGNSLVNLNG